MVGFSGLPSSTPQACETGTHFLPPTIIHAVGVSEVEGVGGSAEWWGSAASRHPRRRRAWATAGVVDQGNSAGSASFQSRYRT